MILDNSRVIIITTDTEGRIVEFNKEAEELLEYTKDEIVGSDILILYGDPLDRSQLLNDACPIDVEIWAVRNREVVLRSKSGKSFHLIITLSTMLDKDGKIIGTVGVGKDISEQKMLQFKLLQSEKLAGIGTLASGIAHEINNPLAGILGMAEAISDEDDMELVKSYASDIIQYSVNASNIVRELSAYSRSARSEARSTVQMSDVIENSLKMARHAASFMSIELKTDLDDDCFVIVNSGEMQQVFVNLVINSIHAMGDQGTVTLKCSREGGFIVASVTDTGGGIPEEHLSQIYDPFFTTKPVGKGTGLGLYVVYRIVTKYGGSIDVETRKGKGTTFRLKFPSEYAAEEAV
jgi:PAS domain S-box-containing protein